VGGLVACDVRQVEADGGDETWERVTEEFALRWVGVERIDFTGGWNVTVSVMEFVRENPMEGELRRGITAALMAVDGVESAGDMDKEVWFVTGTPSGEALVRAVAAVVDDLADQAQAYT
jgi:hypothetical protein